MRELRPDAVLRIDGRFRRLRRRDPVGRIGFPDAADDTSFVCDTGAAQCSVGPPVPAVRICLKSADAKLDVFAGSLRQTIGAYARLAGLPRAPWLPAFALVKWRDQVTGPDDLFDDIHELRSRNIPIGWVILDNPWEQGAFTNDCFGSLRFDPTHFPDPASMIAAIHRRNVRFMLWISPELKLSGCPAQTLPNGWLVGDDQYYLRDLSNPAERADFVSRLRALAALGVDGFKGDRGDEVDLEKLELHAGPGVAFQNAYVRWYQQAAAAAIAPYRRNWAGLFRTSVPGSAAIVPGFVGDDAQQTWDGLQGAIRQAQTAGVGGDAMWGSDIGGYQGGDLTSELFVRWAQFAALTPIFEVGGAGENAQFWQFGNATVAAFREAASLHYELVPYLFTLVSQAAANGVPAVRPLGLTWPSARAAWAANNEFTLGNALLAAPVITPASGAKAATAVYLPLGTWIDLFTGARLTGHRTITRQSGPTDFPLYLRAGTALPFNFRSPEVWAAAWQTNDLERAGRQGWLVAPAPHATASAQSGRRGSSRPDRRRQDDRRAHRRRAPATADAAPARQGLPGDGRRATGRTRDDGRGHADEGRCVAQRRVGTARSGRQADARPEQPRSRRALGLRLTDAQPMRVSPTTATIAPTISPIKAPIRIDALRECADDFSDLAAVITLALSTFWENARSVCTPESWLSRFPWRCSDVSSCVTSTSLSSGWRFPCLIALSTAAIRALIDSSCVRVVRRTRL